MHKKQGSYKYLTVKQADIRRRHTKTIFLPKKKDHIYVGCYRKSNLIITNYFLSETNRFYNNIIFYKCYVDDTFVVFNGHRGSYTSDKCMSITANV